jgi:hypothetical protein
MAECMPSERAFNLAICEGKSGAQAAREAGYGNKDGTSTPETMAKIAYRLLNSTRVVAGLAETAAKLIRSEVPAAIKAVREIVGDKFHKDRLKAANLILERADPTTQKIEVAHSHQVDLTTETLEQLRFLKSLNVGRDKLIEVFGPQGLDRYEQLLIEQDKKSLPVLEADFEVIDDDEKLGPL